MFVATQTQIGQLYRMMVGKSYSNGVLGFFIGRPSLSFHLFFKAKTTWTPKHVASS
jgi:hypothetical protein